MITGYQILFLRTPTFFGNGKSKCIKGLATATNTHIAVSIAIAVHGLFAGKRFKNVLQDVVSQTFHGY